MRLVRRLQVIALVALILSAGCGPSSASSGPIKVGALFPLSGPQAPLAQQEYAGVQIARDFVNAEGGVRGRQIQLIPKELTVREDAPARVDELQKAGVQSIVGAYSSTLSMPASEAAHARGLLYWEAGAVADQLTGRGYSDVFRVGATGTDLGSMSSHFAATVLAGRLGRSPAQLPMVIVHARDGYPSSVASAAASQAAREGFPVVATVTYDDRAPDWNRVLAQVAAAHPAILLLSSYIVDGVAFRRAMLGAGLHVDAMLGTTMAQCVPDFGAMLGADAIGVFASDRPMGVFNSAALTGVGRAVYERFAAAYHARSGQAPTEESLAGFSAAWTLFHYVMPASRDASASRLADAARGLDLPAGTLPNGAGVEFSAGGSTLGQNLRAASVIWQWQGVRHSVVVYPPEFATGTPTLIPLPR